MQHKNKKYTRRNYFSDKLDSENSNIDNNYQNSLISEILKNNKSLKLFSNGDKNKININVNNIKTNIQNIFSTDESKLKAIKYVTETRKDKISSSPRYKSTGKEFFPKLPKYPKFDLRENTPKSSLKRNIFNNEIENNRSYNKRNLLQLSSDNLLFDLKDELNRQPYNYNFKGRDYYGNRTGKRYNKRKINNHNIFFNDNYEDNFNNNNININNNGIKNINTISFFNSTYNNYNKDRNNIKTQRFPINNNNNSYNNNNRNLNINSQKKNKKITFANNNDHNYLINSNKDIDIKDNNKFNDSHHKLEEEKNCINISFSEGGNFFDFHDHKENEVINKNNNSSNKKDNVDEENNKILLFNSHEISFRSFKNENDLLISNNSNNNSIEIFDGLNNKLTKEQKNDSVLSEKKNINLVKTVENNFNIPGNKNDSHKNKKIPFVKSTENNIIISGNNKKLSFDTENDMINYIQNKNIRINNRPICIIYIDEYNKLKEDDYKNENEIKILNKEKELYIDNFIKIQNENELLRQKINEIYYAYQELYKTTIILKQENEKMKNDYEILKDNNNYLKEIQNNEKKLISNEEKINENENNTDIKDMKENNEEKEEDNNNGILSNAMPKLTNFFNEKKDEKNK
jgi:hypothetical protein